MASILNDKWCKRIIESIAQGQNIDEHLTYAAAKQFLIKELSKSNVPFVSYNLGCGVTRITTETNCCPCCKKAIAKAKGEV